MGMMGNPGGPFGGPYQSQGNQGLGPQLQNKGPMANNLAQFNVDKKNQAMQGMAAMVGTQYLLSKNLLRSYANMSTTCLLQWITSPIYIFFHHLPGIPAVTDRCGRSLWRTRRGCSGDGAQQSGGSGGARYPGFCSTSCSGCTTHSWSWEAQANSAAAGAPSSCPQVPTAGAGQRWSSAMQPAPLSHHEKCPQPHDSLPGRQILSGWVKEKLSFCTHWVNKCIYLTKICVLLEFG